MTDTLFDRIAKFQAQWNDPDPTPRASITFDDDPTVLLADCQKRIEELERLAGDLRKGQGWLQGLFGVHGLTSRNDMSDIYDAAKTKMQKLDRAEALLRVSQNVMEHSTSAPEVDASFRIAEYFREKEPRE